VGKVSTALKPKENCQGCSSVCANKTADVNKIMQKNYGVFVFS
jgi:hypothetical protein